MRACDDLHLGEQMPEVLAVHPRAPAIQVRRVRRVVRQRQRRALYDVLHQRVPLRAERGEIGGDPLRGETSGDVVRDEELGSEPPQLVERTLHATMALLRTVAE